LLPNRGVGEDFRRSEVGKNSGELQMLALRQSCRAKHSMSEVAMPSRFISYRFSNETHGAFSVPRRRTFEPPQLFAAMNHGSEVVLTSRDSLPARSSGSDRFERPPCEPQSPRPVHVTPDHPTGFFRSTSANPGPPVPVPLPFTIETICAAS